MNSELKSKIKGLFPPQVWEPISEVRYWFQRAQQYPNAYFHPWRRDSIKKLTALQDRHKGERCFIIGNGPSLARTDISRLKNEFTFGMNRIYLAFEDWGFQTSYLVCVNSLVIEQVYKDFQQLKMPKFFSWRSHKLLYPNGAPDHHTHFLFTTYTGPKFSQDVTGRLWEGATVTYVCLQLAFHMGFEEVILIGIDHNFMVSGKPNTTVVSNGDDRSHFDPGYFGKGFRWQLPDLDTSESGYWMARQVYEKVGRRILDATIEGNLKVFPKIPYDSIF